MLIGDCPCGRTLPEIQVRRSLSGEGWSWSATHDGQLSSGHAPSLEQAWARAQAGREYLRCTTPAPGRSR